MMKNIVYNIEKFAFEMNRNQFFFFLEKEAQNYFFFPLHKQKPMYTCMYRGNDEHKVKW